ncbi:Xaa-Pro aminopeptidase [Phytophthora palmivora]|uniref:Xaa-Pro aminopeptidase n=1 Tax=Phytophthora palmivora TaxID=4796 RepID=A0A2P4X109_9STRA|nr:Xaa-Pro aminopeptidase [Phytophthora palmivora]
MLAAEKLRELRTLMSRTNVRLLPLRHHLGKTEKGAVTELAGRPLQAFLVDTADAHQSEYVGDAHKRREFLTDFTGSNGTALVTPEQALMWTDGRYFLQAEQELSDDWTLMKSEEPGVPTIEQWAKKNLPSSSCLAIDPYLTSVLAARSFAKALKETEIELVALHEENLVDIIWKDRPVVAPSKVTFLSDEYTGRSVGDKLKSLREAVEEKDAHAVVLTALDDIAWLFNIRGNDVEFNPVVTSYAVVTRDSATLFVDAVNQDEVTQHLRPSGVECKPYASMLKEVSAFATTNRDKKILVDPAQCNVAVFLAIPAANRKEDTSIVMAQKAIKSAVEIEGMRQAHLRDGAALVKYFSWLEKEMDAGREDQWDEVLVADKQEQIRQQVKDYVSLSFDTISSIGANGSIIHYSPKRGECAKMSTSAMYLNDSGAQYLDGTTDVTRTLHFGQPTDYEKACFTHVLKAHIALASTIFPDKTEGVRLDAITRAPLWKAGLDYRHGTGHGVGAFLNVHEKGVLMSFRLNPNGLKIQDGMILSNEPGYYEDGKFGIRIESVMVAKKAPKVKSPLNREFCEFETLTMAPIQLKLIDVNLLTPEEIKWLNAYHKEVHDKLVPLLNDDPDTYAYLVRETKPLPLP